MLSALIPVEQEVTAHGRSQARYYFLRFPVTCIKSVRNNGFGTVGILYTNHTYTILPSVTRYPVLDIDLNSIGYLIKYDL